MTGPEHYREAEEFLELAASDATGSDAEQYNLAAAQVHATLALASATAGLSENQNDRRCWEEVQA
jgi:hypothetical protein